MGKESTGIDRRRFLRLDTSAYIKFRRLSDGEVASHQKIAKDISIKGVRFLSDKFIPVSAYLKVNLVFRKNTKPVEFICQVVWVRSIFNDESYEIGAEIIEIDKENHSQIKNYIYK